VIRGLLLAVFPAALFSVRIPLLEESRIAMSSQNELPSIYISYAAKDKSWRDRIAEYLAATGFYVPDDPENLSANLEYTKSQLMGQANVFLILVSPSYLTSNEILRVELPKIRSLLAHGERGVVIVVLRPCPWQAVVNLPYAKVVPSGPTPLVSGDEQQIRHEFENLGRVVNMVISGEALAPTAKVERTKGPKPPRKKSIVSGSKAKNGGSEEKGLARHAHGNLIPVRELERFSFSLSMRSVLEHASGMTKNRDGSQHASMPRRPHRRQSDWRGRRLYPTTYAKRCSQRSLKRGTEGRLKTAIFCMEFCPLTATQECVSSTNGE